MYSLALLFYPPSLRHRFGQEMELVFQDEVQGAWAETGYRGVLRTWNRAAAELISVALPARLELLMVPAVSVIVSFALFAIFFLRIATRIGPR